MVSAEFIQQFSDRGMRNAFVSEQVRIRIAQLIKVLREQPDRALTQSELAALSNKRQNVISRLEDPDGPMPTVQTLLEIAAAFDVPLWIDFPQWDDWFELIKEFPSSTTNIRGWKPCPNCIRSDGEISNCWCQ